MQTATVSGAAGKFFRDFKSFARDAESSCKDLKTNLERPPLSAHEGGNSAQILVENIAVQVDDLTEDIDQLVSCQGFNSTTQHLSLESLFSHCLAVYEKNEELKEELETKLEQYTYQRKDPTKQKASLQSSKSSSTASTSKIPVKSSSQSNIPKPTLHSSSSSSSVSNIPKPSQSIIPPITTIEDSKKADSTIKPTTTAAAAATTSTTSTITTQQSPPHTPPASRKSPTSHLFDDFPRTPTLEDVGISASALELIAKDQIKKQKKASITKESSQTSLPLNFTTTAPSAPSSSLERPNPVKEELVAEKRESTASTGSRSSMEDAVGENNAMFGERRRTKSKKRSGKAMTLFPLMAEIQQEEYNGITPEYLKHSFSLEQLNKAIQKINEHMTDRRFSMDEEVSEGAMESFTEADLRDDLEFGVKAKGLVLLLIQLKRIALDKRFGGTRLTILEKSEK